MTEYKMVFFLDKLFAEEIIFIFRDMEKKTFATVAKYLTAASYHFIASKSIAKTFISFLMGLDDVPK